MKEMSALKPPYDQSEVSSTAMIYSKVEDLICVGERERDAEEWDGTQFEGKL